MEENLKQSQKSVQIRSVIMTSYIMLVIGALTIIYLGITTDNWKSAIMSGLTVLIVVNPIAVAISTPLTFKVGMLIANKFGIEFKNAKSIEKAQSINTVIFDKADIFTRGQPQVISVESIGLSQLDFLSYLRALLQSTPDPFAKAIITFADASNAKNIEFKEIEYINSNRILAHTKSDIYVLGNQKTMQFYNISISKFNSWIQIQKNYGAHILFFANITQNNIVGAIALSDKIKETALLSIQELKRINVKTVLLTQDTHDLAASIANILHFDEVHGALIQRDKAYVIEKIKAAGANIAMVGSHINDVQNLNNVDITITMPNSQNVISLHYADIQLLNDNPVSIVTAIEIAKKIYSKIKQNYVYIFLSQLIVLPLAIVGYINPIGAIIYMLATCVVVSLNSFRIAQWAPKRKHKQNR